MNSQVHITCSDLEDAFLWSSANADGEMRACISKATGAVVFAQGDECLDIEVPDDLEDEDKYWAVPNRHDLELGARLAIDYAFERVPDEWDIVRGMFRHRGAYAKFKAFLDRRGLLDDWYQFELESTEKALLRWAVEEGIVVAR